MPLRLPASVPPRISLPVDRRPGARSSAVPAEILRTLLRRRAGRDDLGALLIGVGGQDLRTLLRRWAWRDHLGALLIGVRGQNLRTLLRRRAGRDDLGTLRLGIGWRDLRALRGGRADRSRLGRPGNGWPRRRGGGLLVRLAFMGRGSCQLGGGRSLG